MVNTTNNTLVSSDCFVIETANPPSYLLLHLTQEVTMKVIASFIVTVFLSPCLLPHSYRMTAGVSAISSIHTNRQRKCRQALQTCRENLASGSRRAKLGGKGHSFNQLRLTLGPDTLMSKYNADFDLSGVGVVVGGIGGIYLLVWLCTDIYWWMNMCVETTSWHWASFLGGSPPSFFDIEISLIL